MSAAQAMQWKNSLLQLIVTTHRHHKDWPQNEVLVYAHLVYASDTTFIKSSRLNKLSVEGPEVNLKLYTMNRGNGETSPQQIDKREQMVLPKVYSFNATPFRRNQMHPGATQKQLKQNLQSGKQPLFKGRTRRIMKVKSKPAIEKGI